MANTTVPQVTLNRMKEKMKETSEFLFSLAKMVPDMTGMSPPT